MRHTVWRDICGKEFLETFFGAVMKKPSKPGHIETPPSNISGYSLDCVYSVNDPLVAKISLFNYAC